MEKKKFSVVDVNDFSSSHHYYAKVSGFIDLLKNLLCKISDQSSKHFNILNFIRRSRFKVEKIPIK